MVAYVEFTSHWIYLVPGIPSLKINGSFPQSSIIVTEPSIILAIISKVPFFLIPYSMHWKKTTMAKSKCLRFPCLSQCEPTYLWMFLLNPCFCKLPPCPRVLCVRQGNNKCVGHLQVCLFSPISQTADNKPLNKKNNVFTMYAYIMCMGSQCL